MHFRVELQRLVEQVGVVGKIEAKGTGSMSRQEIIKIFGDRKIRSVWDDEAEIWYFSIVDVVAVLTESKDPLAYWRKLKQRLKAEGNETVTNCHGLKLRAADGKMRMTDVATAEQMFRVIQSIPSPKAEPFKMWMAGAGGLQTAGIYGEMDCPPPQVHRRSQGLDGRMEGAWRGG